MGTPSNVPITHYEVAEEDSETEEERISEEIMASSFQI